MFNVFEMMRAGQGNPGLDALARQFGLSQEQALQASAALLPAFFLGLQRSAANPDVFANLTSAFSAGPFASFFNNPAQAPPPQAQTQGDEMLGRIFGSAELTRRVAAEAATWSGVSAQVIQQMMPIMAAAVVGSLSKFSEIMREQAAGQAAAPAAASPLMQPMAAWMEMVRAMTGAAPAEPARAAPEPPPKPAPEPRPAETSPLAQNPWAGMALAMLGQMPAASGGAAPEPAPEPEAQPAPPPEPEPAPPDNGQGGLAQLIESGREAQQQYVASLQRVFDQFWGIPDRR